MAPVFVRICSAGFLLNFIRIISCKERCLAELSAYPGVKTPAVAEKVAAGNNQVQSTGIEQEP